jgi:SAM-dependent methyltransferase
MQPRTEFYEVAVRSGFYGVDRSNLFGKKDNVRKFWEDMSIKLWLRPLLEDLLARKPRLRVVDLGCGSGEGFELLTHVPVRSHGEQSGRDFLLDVTGIDYVGIDISPAMVEQGQRNYAQHTNVRFAQADLAAGFTLENDPPFDIYFSSFGSMSHLTCEALTELTVQIFTHATREALVVFDVLGRFSPEWPRYWHASSREMLPYNMAYLLPADARTSERIDWFKNSFWAADELEAMIHGAAVRAGRRVELPVLADRSVFVGRHIETGLFGAPPMPLRYQINRLLDHGYRGQLEQLRVDLAHLAPYAALQPVIWERLGRNAAQWNAIVDLVAALMTKRDDEVRRLIESTPAPLSDDMKMLAWLCRNGERFPVADYWASVVGPQVAMVLRNIELAQPEALGCGHGLFCVAKIRPA